MRGETLNRGLRWELEDKEKTSPRVFIHAYLPANALVGNVIGEIAATVICFWAYYSEESPFNRKLLITPIFKPKSLWLLRTSFLCTAFFFLYTNSIPFQTESAPYVLYKPWTWRVIKHCSSSIKWNKKSSWQTPRSWPGWVVLWAPLPQGQRDRTFRSACGSYDK